MKFIADFHIHSKYSRATSREMNLASLDKWAKIKGIAVLGTGDFTHPEWLKSLKKELIGAEPGLFKLKSGGPTRFILTAEISCIYSKKGRVRKIHIILFAPSFEVVDKINEKLNAIGNLKSDGRPILGLDAKELAKIALEASKDCLVVPAHAWTPWFSIFGSKSGFDSIEECFEEYAKNIYAIETGLSSDPAMNWRLSALDKINLISNSDAHSPQKIGREANIFNTEFSYSGIAGALKTKNPKKFLSTIEFSRRRQISLRRPPKLRNQFISSGIKEIRQYLPGLRKSFNYWGNESG
jgi:DNA helicase-2/ATP-dependent DNA helicase PcrA